MSCFAGILGAGEAYINGFWRCDDLTGLVRLMVVNRDLMSGVDSGWSRVSAPLLKAGALAEPQRQERQPPQHRRALRPGQPVLRAVSR